MTFVKSVLRKSCPCRRLEHYGHYHIITRTLQQELNGNHDHIKSIIQKKVRENTNACTANVGDADTDTLFSMQSTTQIVQCLKNMQKKSLLHNSVYCEAMQICTEMKDCVAVQSIMDMLLCRKSTERHQNVTNTEFETFFDAMTIYNTQNPSVCYKYFKVMTNELQINPNQTIFKLLIKSCASPRKYKLAEEYWKLMETSFNMKANHEVYAEMILVYSKSNQFEKAINKFKEWLSATNEIDRAKTDSFQVFAAYLNIFSRWGDIYAMNTSIQLIVKYKHKLSTAMYTDLIRGCLIAEKPEKALTYFQRLKKDKLTPNEITLDLKAIALLQIIKSNKAKFKAYSELIRHINTEYTKYGFTASPNITSQIIQTFEKHQLFSVNDALNEITFHCSERVQIEFLLRHIIASKLNEFDIETKNGLNIIVGTGQLKGFVCDELLKYDPAIKCQSDVINDGILIIPKHQLLPYINAKPSIDCNLHLDKDNNMKCDDDIIEDTNNEIMKQYLNIDVVHSKRNKELRNNSKILSRSQPKSTQNQNIRNKIKMAKSAKEIIKILDENSNYIMDESVYSKALQKCNFLQNRDYEIINKIMEMMLLNFKVKASIVVFNVFFNSVSFCDQPLKCRKYVDFILNKSNPNDVFPDKTTFPVLIKSVRKQGLYRFAEKYLKIMKGKFNMKPCIVTYTEMLCVYAKSFQKEKAIQIFQEYQERKDLPQENETIFGAFLNVFSRNGDIYGMENVLQLMENKNMKLMNPIILSDIMRTYVVAGKPRKCIKIYNAIMSDKNIEIQASHLSLACIAMSHLIHCKTVSRPEKYQLFDKISGILENEFKQNGFTVSAVEIKPLFEASVGLYGNEDPTKIINLFEKLLHDKLIGYTTFDELYGDHALDLHGFHPSTAQFILRYVFALKLEELLSTMDESNDFVIIVGKGKHSGNKKGILKQFVVNELLSFEPQIECNKWSKDGGQIVIEKTRLKPYCLKDNVNEYLKAKLMYPSNDWFLKDVVDDIDHQTNSLFS